MSLPQISLKINYSTIFLLKLQLETFILGPLWKIVREYLAHVPLLLKGLHHLQLALLPPEPECTGQLTAQEATPEHSDGPAGETGKQAGAELSQAQENYFCCLWLVLVKIDLNFTIGASST